VAFVEFGAVGQQCAAVSCPTLRISVTGLQLQSFAVLIPHLSQAPTVDGNRGLDLTKGTHPTCELAVDTWKSGADVVQTCP